MSIPQSVPVLLQEPSRSRKPMGGGGGDFFHIAHTHPLGGVNVPFEVEEPMLKFIFILLLSYQIYGNRFYKFGENHFTIQTPLFQLTINFYILMD